MASNVIKMQPRMTALQKIQTKLKLKHLQSIAAIKRDQRTAAKARADDPQMVYGEGGTKRLTVNSQMARLLAREDV